MMDEKIYYDEKPETKQMTLVCPHCREEGTFPVRWMMRSKKNAMPPGGDADDRAKFAKARRTWCAWTTWWLAGTCAAASDLT